MSKETHVLSGPSVNDPKSPRRPNYFVVGVPKAGTSWLYQLFKNHSDVLVCSEKEIHYFDRLYEKGENWFLEHFRSSGNEQAVGEVCHDYIYSRTALERIRRDFPEAKIIVMLRDPVDRSVSHYRYSMRVGTIPVDIDVKGAVASNPNIVTLSQYDDHLKALRSIFPSESILILDYADLKSDANEFSRVVCQFLGVDFQPNAVPQQAVNKAAASRSVLLTKIVRIMISALRGTRSGALLGKLKNSKLRGLFFTESKGFLGAPVDREWLSRQIHGDGTGP